MAKSKRKGSKKKIIIFGGLGLLLLVVVLVVVLGGDKEVIISVQTENVENRDITQIVTATGRINPINQVVITPEVSGEIVELPVEEGYKVKKGQLLIRIKPDIYIAQRNRARASLESAKANIKVREAVLNQVEAEYKRVQGLYEKGLASDQELEAAKSSYLQNLGQYESQKAQVLQVEESLKEAEENLAKTAIYSPLNGTISQLNVELGERILGSNFTQGTNIMTVANLTEMEATVEVDENDVVLISVNDTARIEIDAFGDKKFLGQVTQIGNSALTTGLGTQDEVVNFEIKIRLLEVDEGIRPGMSCDADIETETKLKVISVPIQSVTARTIKPKEEGEKTGDSTATETGAGEEVASNNGSEDHTNGKRDNKPKEVVFIVENNEAKMIEVKTGISDDTHIEILEGLDEGMPVVSGPYRAISKDLEEGTKVSVQGKRSFAKKESEN